jgi:hypothetical protein
MAELYHKSRGLVSIQYEAVILAAGDPSLPGSLLRILPHHDATDLRLVRLTHVPHSLSVFARCHLRCILRNKAAVSLEDGVSGAADFVKVDQ